MNNLQLLPSSIKRDGGYIRITSCRMEQFVSNLYYVLTLRKLGVDDALIHICSWPTDPIALARYMISIGATDFDLALEEAAREGNVRCAQYLIECGARDFDEALRTIAPSRAIVELLARYAPNLNPGLRRVCFDKISPDRAHLLTFLISRGARHRKCTECGEIMRASMHQQRTLCNVMDALIPGCRDLVHNLIFAETELVPRKRKRADLENY